MTQFNAPHAKKIPFDITTHGDTRTDPYYWLRERENPETIAYLEAENAYLKTQLAHTEGLQETLFEEMISRVQKTDMSVPFLSEGYWYYSRYEEAEEYPYYCRKKNGTEVEEMMLDMPELAKGHTYYAIGGQSVSPDNEWLAYSVDTVSRRIYTIYFKNLFTGETIATTIPNTTGGCTWGGDNLTVFYQQKDDALRSYKVMRHTLGTDSSLDVCVWHETDETFNTFCYKTRSKKYLVIMSSSTVSNEAQILETNNPTGEFRLFEPRKRDHEYSVNHFEGNFYLHTNWEAQNFRLMQLADTALDTKRENWTPTIAHQKDVLLEGVDYFNDYKILSIRQEGITKIQVCNADFSFNHTVDFGEAVYAAYTSVNPEIGSSVLRLGYTSLTTPSSVFDYDIPTKELHLLKQQAVLGGNFEVKNYATERLWATAQDGTKVPISLVFNKNKVTKSSPAPLLLYAYGSYGHSMDVYFSAARLSLLDRGFTYAIAHIRGGEDLGREWYENGKLLKKKNTFTDFIDCGDFLVKEKYTTPQQLMAMGGSAGGLLMGAVMNMRPDLWKAVIAAVPFVDVVTTMLDESIPLTTGEFDEWGNPKNEEYYWYMKSYSPYDNVEAKAYPHLLVTTGLHDSQVQYWEPAKWVALLREKKTNDNLLFLQCDMEVGHGGASGRFKPYRDIALQYAFLLECI